jgi:adenylate cyclase
MSDFLTLRFYEAKQLAHIVEIAGTVELGRQSTAEEQLYTEERAAQRTRLVIARGKEYTVSRKHAILEPLTSGRARLTNASATRPIGLPDAGELKPGASCELKLPAMLTLGTKTLRVSATEEEPWQLESLAAVTRLPSPPTQRPASYAELTVSGGSEIDSARAVQWFQTLMDVFQSAATTSDFFPRAAKAIVELAGLDVGRVLMLENDEWRLAAHYARAEQLINPPNWRLSKRVLHKVREEKATCLQVPKQAPGKVDSLLGIDAVVASPILDRERTVIGALYGDRRMESKTASGSRITNLQAMLVELLATSVTAGLARLEQEQAALAARVQFEQFFTPELARHLAEEPDLLNPRDATVTVLFCDIRGYSRISERLGTAATMSWISDVLEVLSECVVSQQGVLVDYVGDELMAMWGAPEKQPDHAVRACRAALLMLEKLHELNARWQATLGESVEVGIGVNTGTASVGNIGSRRKFKYGPQGDTVNLASRIQGATKFFKTRLLVTEATRALLDESFSCRRLGSVRVVNIDRTVTIFELVPPTQPNWVQLQTTYEQALSAYENREFRNAARTLGNLTTEYPDDGPSLVLLGRTVNVLVKEPGSFDSVWELPGK